MKKLLLVTLFSVFTIQYSLGQIGTAFETELLVSRFASWGIDPDKHLASINLKYSWKKFKKNKEIDVAVIDTGIQPDHSFLSENIHVLNGKRNDFNYGVDFSHGKSTNMPIDQHGHGTHVAGIIKQTTCRHFKKKKCTKCFLRDEDPYQYKNCKCDEYKAAFIYSKSGIYKRFKPF